MWHWLDKEAKKNVQYEICKYTDKTIICACIYIYIYTYLKWNTCIYICITSNCIYIHDYMHDIYNKSLKLTNPTQDWKVQSTSPWWLGPHHLQYFASSAQFWTLDRILEHWGLYEGPSGHEGYPKGEAFLGRHWQYFLVGKMHMKNLAQAIHLRLVCALMAFSVLMFCLKHIV